MNDLTEVLGTVAMVPKGEYDSSAYYEYLNVVTYEGSTYMAKKAVNNVLPTDEEYWQFIAGGLERKDASLVFDTVADMQASEILKDGMTVQTLGYYEVNDGGGATYKITDTQSQTEYQEEVGDLYATLIISDTINPKQLGAASDGVTDDSLKIQQAINLATNKHKVFCNGNHAINSTLIFNTANCNFESIGNIILLDDIDAFKIDNVSGCNITIKNITASNEGIGVHILANNSTVASTNINVGTILNAKKGIVLESDNTKGIQYSKINWSSIYTTEHGVLLKCGNNGNPWINENQFFGGRISSAVGIETIKGTNQTDKFNGNKFFNFGLEGITNVGLKLNYTLNNIFMNFRTTESFTGTYWFSFTNCEEDVISWQGPRPGLSRNLWEFSGVNKLLHFIGPMRDNGIVISDESIYHKNGWFDAKPLYQPRNNLYNNSTTIDSCRNGMFIRAGADDNKNLVITLPDIMSNDSTVAGSASPYLNYFFLGTLYKGGTINLVDSEGNTIIDNADLEAHKLYMCVRYTITTGNSYQLIVLNTNYS